MKLSYDKHANGISSTWKFRVGRLVLSANRHQSRGGSTLTMTIGRWRFAGFFASTATRYSAQDGAPRR